MYKFLIYISHPYSIPIGKPLEKEIQKRGYQVYWFSEHEYTKSYFEKGTPVLHSVKEVLDYENDYYLNYLLLRMFRYYIYILS